MRLHSRRGLRAVKSIIVSRAEGLITECITAEAKSYREANALLKEMAKTAPASGGYHKVDITVTWSDNNYYEGTFLLNRMTPREAKPIQKWLHRNLVIFAGTWKPPEYTEKQYEYMRKTITPGQEAEALNMLEHYEL